MKVVRLRGGVSLFELPVALSEIGAIEDDLKQNPSSFSPNRHWSFGERPNQDLSASGLEEAWLGSSGRQAASKTVMAEYFSYSRKFDTIGIVDYYEYILGKGSNCVTRAELGTVLDLAVCTRFLDLSQKKIAVLEIGPGYGRLAEAFLNCFEPGRLTYILVDAVPSSIHYSWAYLRRCFPDRRIGYHYAGDTLSPDYDAFVIPIWRFAASSDEVPFDMAINISSFQEMASETVVAYAELIDRRLKPDGYAYFSNSREYITRRQFQYPDNWKIILKEKSPRGWTHDHPLEILQKTNENQRLSNVTLDLAYQQDLSDRVLESSKELKKKLAELQRSNTAQNRKITDQRNMIADLKADIASLKSTLRS